MTPHADTKHSARATADEPDTTGPVPASTRVMLFAAGRGERMRELTALRPKPLLEVAGRPLIAHALDRIAAAGYRDVTVNVAWLGEQIIDWLATHAPQSLRVEVSPEPAGALETAGGILRALFDDGAALTTPAAHREWLLAVNADVLCDHPLAPTPGLPSHARPKNDEHAAKPQDPGTAHGATPTQTDAPTPSTTAAARQLAAGRPHPCPADAAPSESEPWLLGHLVVVPNPPHHPDGDFILADDGRLLPLTIHDGAAAEESGSRVTYSGIGWLRGALFADLAPGRAALGPLLRGAAAAGRLRATLHTGTWIDVGTPKRLDEAEQLWRQCFPNGHARRRTADKT